MQEGSKLCIMMPTTCKLSSLEKAHIAGGMLRGCGECSGGAGGRECFAVQPS